MVPAPDVGTLGAYLYDSDVAHAGDDVHGLAGLVPGEASGLGLVGEDYVDVLLHDVVEEGVVGLHYIV